MTRVKIIKFDENAVKPEYKTQGSSGMDLHSLEQTTLEPGEIKLIRTGIGMELPKGYEAQVRPRSGLSLKGITVVNSPGTIDSDYRGEIKVILTNIGKEPFRIEKEERISQLVIQKVEQCDLTETKKLTKSERGSNGFGSTGRK